MSMYVRTVALFGTQFLNIRDFLCLLFCSQVDIYRPIWMSVNRTMSITSFPRVIPPYRCDEMDRMRRIEKQMCAYPHVRLAHGSKESAHVGPTRRHFVDNNCHAVIQIAALSLKFPNSELR